MSVARLNKSRLNLNNKDRKTRPRNVNRMRKEPSRPLSEIVSSLFRKACLSSICLLMLVLVGVGCLAGYRWLTVLPYFALQDINVTGNHRLSDGEILAISQVGLNKNTLAINISDVESRLSANNWITSAAIKRELPNKLSIHIKEKTPQFMVRQSDKLFYCDSSGELIAPVAPGKFSSLPFLNIESDAMEQAKILPEFMEVLSKRELPFDPGQIAWINIKGGNRMEIFMDRPGLTIRLGMNDWQEQLSNLNIVWNDLKNRGEFRNVAMISTGKDRVWVEKRTSGQDGLR